ncbi:MAG: histidine kinase [Yangia sp.]|nr:histidine kinase [Salipiger sp.]
MLAAIIVSWRQGENFWSAVCAFFVVLVFSCRAGEKRLRKLGRKLKVLASRCSQAGAFHIIAILMICSPVLAQEEPWAKQLRILVIYSGSSTLAANVAVEAGFASVFSSVDRQSRYEIYVEYRDAQRFPTDADELNFIESMVGKYGDQDFNVIVTMGPEALPLGIELRRSIAPRALLLSGGIQDATLKQYSHIEGLSGVLSTFDLRGTFELARQMQPKATRAVVFTGSADFDERWQAFAVEELSDASQPSVEMVSDLTLEEFKAHAAALRPSDILLVLTIFEDADGRRFVPADALAAIAEVSGAPTYGVYSSNIGRGVVGGSFSTFEATGAAIAEQALKILDEPSAAESSVLAPVVAVLDWRELRRFDLDPERRPAGSQLVFYDPSVWERYGPQILAAIAIILLQSSTIAALIVLERRRRRGSAELIQRRIEMARLSRIAQLGELSGAIAHELNQPLTSILANAEAGSALLAQGQPDLTEIGDVLRDIADDDRRAADIIVNLRRLMANDSVGLERADLNDVARSTMRLISNEMVARGVDVQLRLSREMLIVEGDVQQLQQVLLNLVLNAADAMADQQMRKMIISTGLGINDRRLLTVSDNGPGLPDALTDDPFKPFATSKSQGMGLGLSISQNIAEAHGGELRFTRSTKEGACVELALPAP